MARAHEVLGGRWTLLIVREILCGSRRFNDIRRGIPRVSRTVLSERLQALVFAGAIVRTDGPHGPEYELTEAGQELASLVGALGTWGQRWLAREPANEDLDLEPLLVDMQRRVRFTALPKEPFVVRFEVRGHHKRFMLLKKTEASLCHQNPGFPEPVCVRGPLAALVAWWRGDMSFLGAQRMGLVIDGPKAFTRAFPKWFDLYPFAHIGPAGRKTNKSPARALTAMGPDLSRFASAVAGCGDAARVHHAPWWSNGCLAARGECTAAGDGRRRAIDAGPGYWRRAQAAARLCDGGWVAGQPGADVVHHARVLPLP